jgi:cathepsin L
MCHNNKKPMFEQLNHVMLVVGFGTIGDNEFWEVQNSWSEEWGEGGFMLLKRNKTTRYYRQCNLLKHAYVPNIRMNPW